MERNFLPFYNVRLDGSTHGSLGVFLQLMKQIEAETYSMKQQLKQNGLYIVVANESIHRFVIGATVQVVQMNKNMNGGKGAYLCKDITAKKKAPKYWLTDEELKETIL